MIEVEVYMQMKLLSLLKDYFPDPPTPTSKA